MNSPGEKNADEKFCADCGSIIKIKAEICPKCGIRQQLVPHPSISESKKVGAALFALLLGGFGAHKFYLGKPGQAIIYFLFCWTLIPTLIGIIEGIIYLTMSDNEFAAKYERRY